MTADDPITAEELAKASLAIMHREGLKPFTCEEFADGGGANAPTKSAAPEQRKIAAVKRRKARRPTSLAGDPFR